MAVEVDAFEAFGALAAFLLIFVDSEGLTDPEKSKQIQSKGEEFCKEKCKLR